MTAPVTQSRARCLVLALSIACSVGFAPSQSRVALARPSHRAVRLRATTDPAPASSKPSNPFTNPSPAILSPTFAARGALFAVMMAALYPPSLGVAVARAVFQRATKGTPDMILPTGAINALGPGQDGYGGQMLFDRRVTRAVFTRQSSG